MHFFLRHGGPCGSGHSTGWNCKTMWGQCVLQNPAPKQRNRLVAINQLLHATQAFVAMGGRIIHFLCRFSLCCFVFFPPFFFFFLFLAAYYYLRAVWKRARVVLNEFVRCKHISVSYFLARCLFSFALVFPSDVFAEANAVWHKVMSGIAVPNSR